MTMHRPIARAGFTLLELLAAMGITLLLAAVMITVTQSALDAWRRGHARSAAAAQAYVALDLLAADFQAAWWRDDGQPWLAAEANSSDALMVQRGWDVTGWPRTAGAESWQPDGAADAENIATARFGRAGVWLRFVTFRPDSNADARNASAPAAVGWQIVRTRDESMDGRWRCQLRRAIVRAVVSSSGASGTFETGYNPTVGAYTSPASQLGDPGTLVSPPEALAVADRVVDFGVWFYRRLADGSLERVYPRTGLAAEYRWTAPAERLVAAEIMVRVISEEGTARLAEIESGEATRPTAFTTDEAWWWAVTEEHSQVFTRLVELPGGWR